MKTYLRSKRGLTTEQIEYLASTGYDLARRRKEQERTTPIVEKILSNRIRSFQDLFATTTSKPRFLQGGKYGITALVHLPGITSPLVAKFTETPYSAKCEKQIGHMVCRVSENKESTTGRLTWTSRTDPKRERKIYKWLSDIENDGISPHFLHTYLEGSVGLTEKASIKDVATWLGASSQKAGKYGRDAIRNLSVTILEYGGASVEDVMKHIVSKTSSSRRSLDMLRSCVVQVFQALATMAEVGNVHHNDCHIDNILGSATNAEYLYYQVIQVKGGRGGGAGAGASKNLDVSRTFRIPTFGILYRIIDFGYATSTDLFGPLDHGIMARTADGGPMWRNAVGPETNKMPLELFDAARVLDNLLRELEESFPRVTRGPGEDDLMWVIRQAMKLGKSEKQTFPIKEVHILDELNVSHINTPAKMERVQKDIRNLATASDNHKLMVKLFMDTASHFGYEISEREARAHFHEHNTYVLVVEHD